MVHAQLAQTAQGIFHVNAALHLLYQQLRDAVGLGLFMPQTVEQHRRLHGAEGLTRKALCQRIPCGSHQLCVEGAADLQRDAAAGTGFLCQRSGLLHSGFLTADDQLPRAVVVADLHTARLCSLFAAGRQFFSVQPQHGGHAAVKALCGLGHGLAPEGGQLDGLLCGEHPGCLQRGVFAQRKPRQIGGLYALFGQHGGHTAGKGHHAGLGVFGLVQNAVRIFKADAVQVKIQRCAVKGRPEGGRCFVKFLAHAGVLRTLTGVKYGKLHKFCLHSVTSSSISSRTVRIRSSLPTFSPQKKSPSSMLPFTASMRAWVMQ